MRLALYGDLQGPLDHNFSLLVFVLVWAEGFKTQCRSETAVRSWSLAGTPPFAEPVLCGSLNPAVLSARCAERNSEAGVKAFSVACSGFSACSRGS